ncbi:hypothetical protein B0H17DRAFT_1212146 [Mycena rosella]|uniref:DUF8205 domain-containing protein n=1 Tax=Mycena rosella TaxID=1033263 RepID=A0AAD7CTQ5_MYCRO|nr:hypothetical protein B0H17DRAFT_1222893 [Mycena rosella]KAJ7661748.1 hypothetical protein B0H17DRAFT_1212146 [Mycena rosella]
MSIQIHAIHPDNEANFKALATTPQNIRSTRSAIHTACTNCFKNDGKQLRRCAKDIKPSIIRPWCQKAHCPQHKKSCSNVDGSGILKLVQTFYANKLLNTHLQACFILQFDLLRRPQLDKPFMVRVNIDIEPADMPDFFNIFIRQTVLDKIKGMLQVNAFTPVTPAAMADLRQMRKDIWRETRDSAHKVGFKNDSVGLAEIGNAASEQTITAPVHIK